MTSRHDGAATPREAAFHIPEEECRPYPRGRVTKIPILKLRNILLTSIQVDLTDDDALDFQADILEQVRKTEAKAVVIDITALGLIDSHLIRILNETAELVGFLGAQAVLCGMRPAVALTLAEMGHGLKGAEMALNLDQAFDKVERIAFEQPPCPGAPRS